MLKNVIILGTMALVVALPFVFRKPPLAGDWRPGDPELVIVSPHNEAIRYEFEHGFSKWHQAKYGKPVKVDWRNLGGTTEISRYLTAQYTTAARNWWTATGQPWPAGMNEILTDSRFDLKNPPKNGDAPLWQQQRKVYEKFRQVDNAQAFTSKIDLFFGGGDYDHNEAFKKGLTVPPWPKDKQPRELFYAPDGTVLIPESLSGETWRTEAYFGCVVSTFGIVYNHDRLKDLGVTKPPMRWDDLADPVYFRQVGVVDPTKSGSIAKAFEMLIHQKVHDAVAGAGFSSADIKRYEKAISAAKLPPGQVPSDVPKNYQDAVQQGWLDGMRLVQQIGANARYFTDSSGKAPLDVSLGDAAVGMAIDFMGRFQAEYSKTADGRERMTYITPKAGSSVSADPISLLRGAPNRELAVRFIEFVLSSEGQKLWNYRPDTPGGPEKYALRRAPIRRDFYPSTQPGINAIAQEHAQYTADNLTSPSEDPYTLAQQFTYYRRWTGSHFGVQRDLIRAMCLDSADELKAAWQAILEHGGPERNPLAMNKLGEMPVDWVSALKVSKAPLERLETLRQWTTFFRDHYREAQRLAEETPKKQNAQTPK